MNDLDDALELIEAGYLLPVDLHARLVEQGFDVEALIEIHSP
ncbi:hypothetical protein [Litchfieldella qijiaojingensis]|nr:hypothetical protein [Halomonas qijiaojingensis]